MAISDQEWDQRILCSDGNCIGIIGSDGRCKECGLPYEGQRPLPPKNSSPPDDENDALPVESDSDDEEKQAAEDQASDSEASGDHWAERTLCIDESCIGVVGPNGRCKVCGQPHPEKQS